MIENDDINDVEKKISKLRTHKLNTKEYHDLLGQNLIKRFNYKNDLNDVDEAIKCFSESLKLGETIYSYYSRSKAFLIKNEKDKAKDDYINAEKLSQNLKLNFIDNYFNKELLDELKSIFKDENEDYIMFTSQKFFKVKEIPTEFYNLVIECNYLFLCTSRNNIPDTHMMMFAYCDEEKNFILSSKRDKKVEDINFNCNVSLLLHSKDLTIATTIYSKAEISKDSKKYKEILSQKYMNKNSAFINEESEIIIVPVDKILICSLDGKSSRYVLES